MTPRKLAILLLFLAAPVVWPQPAAVAAAPAVEGIVVTGGGESMAKPDQLEIDLATTGSAELTADALVKYRDAVQKTQEAFGSLGMPNLKLKALGLGMESAAAGQNAAMIRAGLAQGNAATKATTDITGTIRLVLTGIDQLAEQELTDVVSKLLDTARDSGAAIGGGSSASTMMARIYGQQLSQSLVTFVVANPEAAREEAYQKAFAQARSRAERLAHLAGVKLGKVLSLDEAPVEAPAAESSRQARLMAAIYGMGETNEPTDGRVTSEKFGDIPVRVSLRVRFAVVEGEP